MGESQHEVFRKGIPDAEGDVVLVELPEPGIHMEIVQHVVHPAHVPLQIEAQPSDIGWPRHHRPGGGFFRQWKARRDSS